MSTFTHEEIKAHFQTMFCRLEHDFRILSFIWLWTPTGYRLKTFPHRTYHARRYWVKL
jgi:hypothetical protein